MTIDELLFWINLRQDVLVSEDEIWWSSLGPDRRLERELRRHKRGVRVLLRWSSIATCPARDTHRQYWRYDGEGRFICEACLHFVEAGIC